MTSWWDSQLAHAGDRLYKRDRLENVRFNFNRKIEDEKPPRYKRTMVKPNDEQRRIISDAINRSSSRIVARAASVSHVTVNHANRGGTMKKDTLVSVVEACKKIISDPRFSDENKSKNSRVLSPEERNVVLTAASLFGGRRLIKKTRVSTPTFYKAINGKVISKQSAEAVVDTSKKVLDGKMREEESSLSPEAVAAASAQSRTKKSLAAALKLLTQESDMLLRLPVKAHTPFVEGIQSRLCAATREIERAMEEIERKEK